MNARAILFLSLKITVLTVLFALGMTVGGAVFVNPVAGTVASARVPTIGVYLGFLLIGFVDTLVVALVILRTRCSGCSSLCQSSG
jgi:hypothetical protein